MKSFEYASPDGLEEALELLSENWGESEIYAGGTDVVTVLKQGLSKPSRVVSLRKIGVLQSIDVHDDAIVIGAMTTLKDLAAHSAVQEHFPALVQAVHGVGAEQITAFGTVGGDLCQRPRCWYYRNGFGLLAEKDGESLVRNGDNRYHAIFGTDGKALFVNPSSLAPALIALGASVQILGPGGAQRELLLKEFFRAPESESERETFLAPNEILTTIKIPVQGLKNGLYEVRHRHGLDWPYVAAAVALGDGEASVVLGHVAAVPWHAEEASEILASGPLDQELADKAAEAATRGAQPLSRNAYKVAMVKAAVRRAAYAAAGIEES